MGRSRLYKIGERLVFFDNQDFDFWGYHWPPIKNLLYFACPSHVEKLYSACCQCKLLMDTLWSRFPLPEWTHRGEASTERGASSRACFWHSCCSWNSWAESETLRRGRGKGLGGFVPHIASLSFPFPPFTMLTWLAYRYVDHTTVQCIWYNIQLTLCYFVQWIWQRMNFCAQKFILCQIHWTK